MKSLFKLFTIAMFVLSIASVVLAQQSGVQLPRESQRAEVAQTVGDTRIAIVYHRPNTKGRLIFGEEKDKALAPYGKVWRTGANENTTFEVSENVKINGQDLPAGKYGLHTIPGRDEWIIIFNKVNNEWGSFKYDEKQDQLRVRVKPQTVTAPREIMMFEFDQVTPSTANLVIEWDTLRVPFTIDVGDVNARVLGRLRQNVINSGTGDAQAQVGARMQAASFVLDSKMKSAYPEASKWLDEALKMREGYATLRAKARVSAEMGNYKDAVAYGEKAITAGKALGNQTNADALANLEKDVASWKTKM